MRENYLQAMERARSDDPELWIAVKVALKREGITRDIERQLKKRRLSVVDKNTPPELVVVECLEAAGIPRPEGLDNTSILPPFYCLDQMGTGIMALTDVGLVRNEVAPFPLIILRRFRNHLTNEEMVSLAWWTGNQWRTVRVPRANVVTAHLLTTTSTYGVPVGSCNTAFMAEYLYKFLTTNETRLSTEQTTHVFGFQGEKGHEAFLWGSEQIGPKDAPRIEFIPSDAGDRQVQLALSTRGTLAEWLEGMAVLRNYPVAQLMIYAAITSPLVRILGSKNVAIDHSGRTSTAKTTMMHAGASSWGDPIVLCPSFDSTLVGFERRAGLMNDLPQYRDDSKQLDQRHASKMVYSMYNGCGRTRGSRQGTAQALEWRTCFHTTGESRLNSQLTDSGGKARILSITRPALGNPTDATRRIVDRLNLHSRTCYGHLGPAFVAWLLANHERWPEFRKRFKARAESYLSHVTGPGARLADSAAVISTAGELLHEAIQMPWRFNDPFIAAGLWADIEGGLAEIDAGTRCLNDLLEWATANRTRFWGSHRKDAFHHAIEPVGGFVGVWRNESQGWENMVVFPRALKDLCERWDHDFDEVVSTWKDRGDIEKDGTRPTVPIKFRGKTTRGIMILRKAFDVAVFGPSETPGTIMGEYGKDDDDE